MAGRIEGRIAIVTGAASGIGRAVGERFLEEGAKLVAVDKDGDALDAAYPDEARLLRIVVDVTDAAAPPRIVAETLAAFGGLDILVNNAGVVDFAGATEASDESWERTMATNVTAVFRLTRAAIPHLVRSGHGRIVNTASILALDGGAGVIAYTASKHAVAGLTKSLALELGSRGVTANYVLPGAILTGITRAGFAADPALRQRHADASALGRIGMPEDVAPAFLFLASDEAAYITGHGLVVDGGTVIM